MMLRRIKDNEGLSFWEDEVDNIYDPSFVEAVKCFQRYLDQEGFPNIVVDGKWGRKMYGWATEILIEQDSANGLTMDRILHKWGSPRK